MKCVESINVIDRPLDKQLNGTQLAALKLTQDECTPLIASALEFAGARLLVGEYPTQGTP